MRNGNSSQIEEVFKILNKYDIKIQDIEKSLLVLVGKPSNVIQILELLEKEAFSKETIKNCLSVLISR